MPQGQAPGLNKPGKGTGGEGLALDRPQQLASLSSPTPRSSAAGLCPASFPGEGRSHLELHLALRSVRRSWVLRAETRKSETRDQRPWPREHQPMGEPPSTQKPRGLRKSPGSPTPQRRGCLCRAPQSRALRGRPLPLRPGAGWAQQEHREDPDRKMEQPERRSASGQDAEVVRVTKDRRQG